MNYTKVVSDALDEALYGVFTEDANWQSDPEQVSALSAHDKRYHPDGYEEGQFCRYRESLERGDDPDKLAAAEADEDKSFTELAKYMKRLEGLGAVILTYPQEDSPKYGEVLDAYGIDEKSPLRKDAKNLILTACEDYENIGGEPGDNVGVLKGKVLDVDMAISALKNGKNNSKTSATAAPIQPQHAVQNANNSTQKPGVNQLDIDDLREIRNFIEKTARLLNGRAGNLQALQSSSRWPALQAVVQPNSQIVRRLGELKKSTDVEVARGATTLHKIVDEMVKSSKAGWANKVSNVPSWEQL